MQATHACALMIRADGAARLAHFMYLSIIFLNGIFIRVLPIRGFGLERWLL